MQKLAIAAVMLMLFELGFALGGYGAMRTAHPPAPPKVIAVARPVPIEIAPIVIESESVVRSEGARVRVEERTEDRAVR